MRYGALFTKQRLIQVHPTQHSLLEKKKSPFQTTAVKHSNKNSLGTSNDEIPFQPFPSIMQELDVNGSVTRRILQLQQ
jgi:hypothetical protein